MGGSSKSGAGGTQTYNYYATIAGGICIGPVSDLLAIIIDGEEQWPRGIDAWRPGLNILPGKYYVFDGQTWTCFVANVATAANAPGGTDTTPGWTEYTFKYHGNPYDDFTILADDGTLRGTIRFYWGTAAQTVDANLQAAHNNAGIPGNYGHGDDHPDYKGMCYIVLIDFLLGQEVQSAPNVEVVVRRAPNQALITGGAATIKDGQANPAAVLAEVLTDPSCLGLPTTMIDTASFQAVANYLDTNAGNYNCSVLIDSSEELRSFLEKMVALFDGFIRFNPATQLIELGVYEHGVTPNTYMAVTTITADMLTAKPKFSTTSWQQTVTRATVRYNSRQLNYQQTSVQCDDARAFFVLGMVRDQQLDRPYIAREGQALWHGRETLRVTGHAQTKGTLEVRREFSRNIRAGDFVFVDVDLEPGGASIYQYFRVTQRKLPSTGPITLDLFADNTLATVHFSAPYPTTLPGTAAVSPLTAVRVFQPPQALSGDNGAITVLAQRADNLTAGCQLWFDTARVLSVALVSLVADATGTVGILTFASSPGFSVGDYIDVGGATNGTYLAPDGVTILNAFNVSQAQVTYATGTIVKYALNGTVAANLAATGSIVVADYFTTFSVLGNIPNFAAKCSLHTALTSGAATLDVDVDTTQADADLLTVQSSSNDQADDTMLAIIVHLVGTGADANQIAETSGYGQVEICSIGATSLTSAGRYSLSVLRGRQGTTAAAFATANTEVWIIARGNLAYFNSGAFAQIRANRLNNTVPQYAQFRFCPVTFAGVFPLSDAANSQFRFPLKSAGVPTLTLTSPGAGPLTYSAPTRIEVSGTWTDSDSNLVEARLAIRLSTESTDRVIFDSSFAQTGSFAFDRNVYLDKPGNWTIKLSATDATGITTEQDILVTISGGVAKCAPPEIFDANGNLIPLPFTLGIGVKSPFTNANANAWNVIPRQPIPFGAFKLSCSTPGANILFNTTGAVLINTALGKQPAQINTYNLGSLSPFHALMNPGTVSITTGLTTNVVSKAQVVTYRLYLQCTAAGYTASDLIAIDFTLFV